MAEFCTCGAQLVPDSLFCHKCGKPQREIAAVEPELPVAVEPAPAAVAPLPPAAAPKIDFHNRIALKVALLMALLATMLSFLPYLNMLAAGFFAVLMYRRRTGQFLNLESGVKLGWIRSEEHTSELQSQSNLVC